MCHVDHAVVDQGKINVVNGNDNVRTAGILPCNVLLLIYDLAGHKSGKVLFQNAVHCLRKLLVDGKIYVRAGSRFLTLRNGKHLSHVINHHRLIAFGSLQRRFHVAFNAALSDNVIDPIAPV